MRSIAEYGRSAHEPPLEVPQVVILDFDRTIVDPADSLAHFYALLGKIDGIDIDIGSVDAARRETEQRGDTFSPFAYVRTELEKKGALDELLAAYALAGQQGLQYDDVAPFMGRMEEGGVPYTLFTYGEDWLGQWLKVKASGYAGGVLITPEKQKSRSVRAAEWEEGFAFGTYAPPPRIYYTRSVCLIDDKPVSFTGWPGPGFCIRRGMPLPSQEGDLPLGVRLIDGLDELVVHEGRVVHRDDFLSLARHVGAQALAGGAAATRVRPIPNKEMPLHSETRIMHI